MTDERPEETVETICPVDQKPCDGIRHPAARSPCPTKETLNIASKVWASLTHWNYRVVRTVDPEGEVEYGVYECYWAEDKMISRTEEPVTSTYDTMEDLRRDVEAILAALDKEILEEDLQRGIIFHNVQPETLDNLGHLAKQAVELRDAIRHRIAEYRRDSGTAIGLVLTRWEALPNELKSAPGMEELSKALDTLNDVVETAAEL